ncbi:hypothetical protein HYV80_06485 [Candidatus Woesearchaeota archaeon]|nr:hypothetical protein [Candidatus Woesearchaeota archaeon]
MVSYIVAATDTQVWAVNPTTRQLLRMTAGSERLPVLGIYANGAVYHAVEVRERKEHTFGRQKVEYDENSVQVKDTISGNTAITVHPSGQKSLPLEQRVVPLNFRFIRRGNSLLYSLNGSEGVIFPQIGSVEEQDYGIVSVDGKNIYLGARRVATLDSEPKFVAEINQSKLSGSFRKKNPHKFEKNKEFFKV